MIGERTGRSDIGVGCRLDGAGRAGVDARLCTELTLGDGMTSTTVGRSNSGSTAGEAAEVAGTGSKGSEFDSTSSDKVAGVGGSIPASNSEILKERGG